MTFSKKTRGTGRRRTRNKGAFRETGQKMDVRGVELSDIPMLRRWYSDPESRRQLYAPPQPEAEFAHYMMQPHRFIVLDAGDPVATFRLEEQGEAAVLGVMVAPGRRGKGLGKITVGLAEREAKVLGFSVLSVDIYSDNDAAIETFASSGFREFIWYEKNL